MKLAESNVMSAGIAARIHYAQLATDQCASTCRELLAFQHKTVASKIEKLINRAERAISRNDEDLTVHMRRLHEATLFIGFARGGHRESERLASTADLWKSLVLECRDNEIRFVH